MIGNYDYNPTLNDSEEFSTCPECGFEVPCGKAVRINGWGGGQIYCKYCATVMDAQEIWDCVESNFPRPECFEDAVAFLQAMKDEVYA